MLRFVLNWKRIRSLLRLVLNSEFPPRPHAPETDFLQCLPARGLLVHRAGPRISLTSEYTELGEHARSDGLRKIIQDRIDATEASGKNYDAILLLFGSAATPRSGSRLGSRNW